MTGHCDFVRHLSLHNMLFDISYVIGYNARIAQTMPPPQFEIMFTVCALNNESVVTHEVRRGGQHIVKREKTGKVTMTCNLSSIQYTTGGIVCTSFGIILILDINNVIHFINDTEKVVSRMCLKDLKILHAERLFLDKHDRVWINGKHKDKRHDERVYITGLSK